MIDKLNEHFSFTTPASVHDEESLTALELAGRQSAKINEIIDDQKDHRISVERIMNEEKQNNELFKAEVNHTLGTIPDTVSECVTSEFEKNVEDGTFEDMIDEYAGGLIARVDNLAKLPAGSTTGDAELIDGRVDYAGQTYPSIGEAFRTVTESIYKRYRSWVVGVSNLDGLHIDPINKLIQIAPDTRSNVPFAYFTASSYIVPTWDGNLGMASINYADVWGSRTSGGTFYVMYSRSDKKHYLKELDANFPTETTGDDPIIAIILFKNDGSVLHVTACTDILEKTNINGVKYGSDPNAKTLSLPVNQNNYSVIFNRIACVGDSFTSGHIEGRDGGYTEDNEKYSYPHYLGNLLNAEVINCGVSGFRISDLFEGHERAERLSEKLYQITDVDAIFVGIGLNDYNKTDVGTPDDDSETPTFYGGFKLLIDFIRELNPNAHIFFQNCPDMGSPLFNSYNQVYTNLVDVVYADDDHIHLLDLWDHKDLYQTEKLARCKIGNHYNAIGYQQLAENLNAILNEYIGDHLELFDDVHNPPSYNVQLMNELYETHGVDKELYPYMVIMVNNSELRLCFSKQSLNYNGTNVYVPQNQWYRTGNLTGQTIKDFSVSSILTLAKSVSVKDENSSTDGIIIASPTTHSLYVNNEVTGYYGDMIVIE